jgi:cytochrome c oxidase cbb3-type subunit 1
MMAIRSVNVVSHFTDWTIGHVHSGALGWNAMVAYGTFYYMVPRMVSGELYSYRLANIHFGLAMAGTMIYVFSMWGAGLTQGLLWLSLDKYGNLLYSFIDIMTTMQPYYLLRLVGGLLFLSGTILMAYNLYMTVAGRPITRVRPPLDPAGAQS